MSLWLAHLLPPVPGSAPEVPSAFAEDWDEYAEALDAVGNMAPSLADETQRRADEARAIAAEARRMGSVRAGNLSTTRMLPAPGSGPFPRREANPPQPVPPVLGQFLPTA